MSIIDIAKGNRRQGFPRERVGGYQSASTVRNATVQADSDGGSATVLIDGSDEPVTLACEAPVSQGQRCTVAFQSGSYTVVTLGDVPQRAAAAGEAAESAQQAASAAQQAAAAASAAADAAAEQAQAAVDGITDVTATVNGVVHDVTELSTEVSGAVDKADAAVEAASLAQQDIDGFKQTVSQTYATKGALASTDAKADAASEAAQGAQSAADAAQSDLDAYKGTASTTYATKTELSQTASSITQSVSETYVRQDDASETYATKSQLTETATSITQSVSETYATNDDVSKNYATKSELALTADSINSTVSNLSGAVTSVTQTADDLTIRLGDAEDGIEVAKDTADGAASAAQAAKDAAADAKSEAEGASSAASSAQSAAKDAADDANVALNRATYQFGTCSTAAGTAAKVVALSGFARFTGATVQVKFTYANTASSPTLNVNSTGAAQIRAYGAALTSSSAYNWVANAVVAFVFDGTYWNVSDGASLSKANSAQSTANSAQSAAGSAQSTANSAKSAATAAQTAANNAAKTATNFIQASSAGVCVGDMQGSSIRGNTLITPDGMQVRNGSTVLSEFGADSATLLEGAAEFGVYESSQGDRTAFFGCEQGAEFRFAYATDGFNRTGRFPMLKASDGSAAIYGRFQSGLYEMVQTGDRLVGGRLLFSNTSGATSNVTLNTSAANFVFIEIAYGDGTRYYTKRVYSPNGKYVTIDRQIYNANYYLAANNYRINGTEMTYQAGTTGQALISNGTDQVVDSNRQLKVYQVIGWR